MTGLVREGRTVDIFYLDLSRDFDTVYDPRREAGEV